VWCKSTKVCIAKRKVVLSFSRLSAMDPRIAPMIQWLEPALSLELIQTRLSEMFLGNYQCLGAFNADELIGIAGISTRTHTFSGLVMYVENVVLNEAARGRGVGERLMAHVEELARDLGCLKITLDAYQKNHRARAFYERIGFDPRGVHFVKDLV
jgi:GNAT superfamily N-acetyltransferase